MPYLLALFFNLALICSARAQTEQQFSVKKPPKRIECQRLIKLPQYQPTQVISDSLNVLLLDSMPPQGTCLTLWTSEALIVECEFIYSTKGEIFKIGCTPELLIDERIGRFLSRPEGTLILYVSKIFLRNKVSNANWTYIVKLKQVRPF